MLSCDCRLAASPQNRLTETKRVVLVCLPRIQYEFLMKTKTKTTRKRVYPILQQIVQYLPEWTLEKLANKYRIDARSFSATSHVVALMVAHLAHTSSLNETCDVCSMHEKKLRYVRNVTPPHRNTLSNANRTRPAAMAEELFWTVKAALETNNVTVNGKTFNQRGRPKGFLHRFRKTIYAIDSTTIQLVLNCIDWAKHRRRKAAAKAHVLLNITSFLPSVVVVESANHHDSTRAAALTAGFKAGDILLADRGYVDFGFLFGLEVRRAFFVTRQRGPLKYEVKEGREVSGDVISDEVIVLTGDETREKYTKPLRRIFAVVELNGQKHDMVFLTNNLDWAAETICELYRARWNIEVFFKELKQTLQFTDFIGYNENAVKWQVWIGLLVHMLLHYAKFLSTWTQSFARLVGIVRGGMWLEIDLVETLILYGTAGPEKKPKLCLEQACFKGFEDPTEKPMGQKKRRKPRKRGVGNGRR